MEEFVIFANYSSKFNLERKKCLKKTTFVELLLSKREPVGPFAHNMLMRKNIFSRCPILSEEKNEDEKIEHIFAKLASFPSRKYAKICVL